MRKISNMSMSPAMQDAQMAMMNPQGVDKEEIFRKLFTDKAYGTFSSKYPHLASYLQNFKVINIDADEGYAVGAFFLKIGSSESMFMVPIILQNNTIQPIMFIYSPDMDLFLPLNKEWIGEIIKRTEVEAGELSRPNLTDLRQNDSILQHAFMPRTQGLNTLIHKLGSLKEASQQQPLDIPEIVKGLSKEAKESFLNLIQKSTKIAKYYFGRYPLDKIKESFKVAAKENEKATKKEEIVVATPHTPLNLIKKEFGKDHVVMDDIALKGYSIKDDRKTDNKVVVFTEYLNSLENPSKSGVYEVYIATGKMTPALVIQAPIMIEMAESCLPAGAFHPGESYKNYHLISKNEALVLFPEGDYTFTRNDNILAAPTFAESIEGSPVYKTVYGDTSNAIPIDKPFIFIKRLKNGYIATEPITIKSKVEEGGAIRCTTSYGDKSIIYSSDYKGNTIYVTRNNTVFVPDSFKVLLLKERVNPTMVVGSMRSILTMTSAKLLENGGKPITIVKDDRGEYGVESNRPVTKHKAIIKIAEENSVNAKEVEKVFDEMDKIGSKVMTMFVLKKTASIKKIMTKEAQGAMDPAMMQAMQAQQMQAQQMGGQQMPMPPMDPAMMQAMQAQQMGGQQMPMDPAMMQAMQAQQMGGQQMPMPMDPATMQAMQAQQMGQPMMPPNPQMPMQGMEQGVDMANGLGQEDLFDVSALSSLSYVSRLEELFPKYLPNLITALDNLARIIINFWITSEDLQDDVGITEYTNLENKLKILYENLSDLLLTLNKKIDIFSYK